MADVQLKVNGKVYGGWTEMVYNRSIKAVCAGFRLQVTDHRTEGGDQLFIKSSDVCELLIHGKTVLTGYVEEIRNSLDASSHAIEVAGRDKTGDLVDCAAVYKNHEVLNVDLLQLAQLLIEPFGLSVSADVDVGPKFTNFSIKPGETVFECLERAARLRGLLFSTDGEGNLVITKLAAERATGSLVLGENIKSAEVSIDTKARFSEYLVKGQITATDENYGENAAHVEGTAEDGGVKRHRPMVIVSENQASGADAKKRAEWEAAVRAANASTIKVTVQGFEQTDGGDIWTINQLVPLDCTALGVKQDLLVGEVEMRLSESGSETNLTLQRPDAFVPEPSVATKSDPAAGYP